jgi:hypothetical protein
MLSVADALLRARQRGRIKGAFIRRAVSSCYYAVFHEMAGNCADCLIGRTAFVKRSASWAKVYRALDHKLAKDQCSSPGRLASFPEAIQSFAVLFVSLQKERHNADYDPSANFTRSEALRAIAQARSAIAAFRLTPLDDRRAFAAHVLFKARAD